jgi:hypothetical protein
MHAGGTFALYSLLRQHVNFSGKSVPVPVTRLASDANLRFHSRKSSQQPRMLAFLEGSSIAQAVITYLVLVGTCMVMGDGALTPSISGIYFTPSPSPPPSPLSVFTSHHHHHHHHAIRSSQYFNKV